MSGFSVHCDGLVKAAAHKRPRQMYGLHAMLHSQYASRNRMYDAEMNCGYLGQPTNGSFFTYLSNKVHQPMGVNNGWLWPSI
jgi:hypothetical protein